MKYKILDKSWSKRRKLDTPQQISQIEFIDFVKQHNHFCKMRVHYQNEDQETLTARVIYNEIKNHWTVDGMKVAVLLED